MGVTLGVSIACSSGRMQASESVCVADLFPSSPTRPVRAPPKHGSLPLPPLSNDGGLAAVTKSLATEYAATGIRVNAVSPGVIKTPMFAPEAYEGLGALHPMGRMGELSDVVRAVMYLESAPFVTGEFLHVDGGQSAGH